MIGRTPADPVPRPPMGYSVLSGVIATSDVLAPDHFFAYSSHEEEGKK